LLFEVSDDGAADGLVLFLYIDFAVRKRDIRGYIAMMMDIPSLEMLRDLLAEFITRVIGEDAAGGATQPRA
jgi:chemotaxis protein CheC